MSAYSEAIARAKAAAGRDVIPPLDGIVPGELAVGGADEHTVGGGNAPAHQDFSEVIAHAETGGGEGFQPGAPEGQAKPSKRTRTSAMGKKAEEFSTFIKTAGIEHGIVFGWGIVCKDESGNDYIDVQGDHIPEDAMLDAAADFAKGARPGKEMHSGPEVGQHVFLFPLTGEIAKALGLTTKKTGLLLGYKPPADMLEKFRDGTFTGFSIGGQRIEDEEVA